MPPACGGELGRALKGVDFNFGGGEFIFSKKNKNIPICNYTLQCICRYLAVTF